MGRYARIKENTNLAVSWIVDTARLYGKVVDISCAPEPPAEKAVDARTAPSPAANLPTSDPPAKKGRLKGKA